VDQSRLGKISNPAGVRCSHSVRTYIHGGAYTLGHPLINPIHLLRIAETLHENSNQSSIFAVKYTLTPEAKFPTRYQETVAPYEYLINEMGVDPSKIIFQDESTGGHLILATLYALAEKGLLRPGAAFLIAPWVDLTNSDPTVKRNRHRDNLATSALDTQVRQLVGKDRKDFSHLMNFASRQRPGFGLENFPPSFTWVKSSIKALLKGTKFY
jgi:acetyl esterase/lipase